MRGWEANERDGIAASIDAFAECFRIGRAGPAHGAGREGSR